ncbi:MAG: hypothetical protein AABW52_04750, partial [Nanoarchaeota archaeon]
KLRFFHPNFDRKFRDLELQFRGIYDIKDDVARHDKSMFELLDEKVKFIKYLHFIFQGDTESIERTIRNELSNEKFRVYSIDDLKAFMGFKGLYNRTIKELESMKAVDGKEDSLYELMRDSTVKEISYMTTRVGNIPRLEDIRLLQDIQTTEERLEKILKSMLKNTNLEEQKYDGYMRLARERFSHVVPQFSSII